MKKRQTNQEVLIARLLHILDLTASPADALPEAVRKALLAAYLSGYSDGLQDNIQQGPKP